jgi:uncharacterized protein (TIGR00369 family)
MSDAVDAARQKFGTVGFLSYLGVKLDHLESDRCRLTLPLRAQLMQAYGYMHGGVIAALADTAVAFAIYAATSPDCQLLTVGMDVHYLSTVRDLAVADARIVRRGNTLAVGEVEITDGKGNQCARATVTYILRPAKSGSSAPARENGAR